MKLKMIRDLIKRGKPEHIMATLLTLGLAKEELSQEDFISFLHQTTGFEL